MAYITKSNAIHLEYQVNRSSIEKILVEDLYKLSLWMFTKKEQQWLAAARIFYENPEFYIDHIYEKVERQSNINLVYVAGVPAYHTDKNCEFLHRSYVNYVIPPEIVDRGEAAVIKFREWWKSEEALLHSDPKRLLEKMGIRWLLKNPPTLESIEASNSGVELTENRSVDEVESEINNLIISMNKIRLDHKNLIDNFGKKTYGMKNGSQEFNGLSTGDKFILENWHQKKEDLKKILRLYFQLRFNPELEIKGSILESVGFRPCAQCHGKG